MCPATGAVTCAPARLGPVEWARGLRVPYPGGYPRADEDLGHATVRSVSGAPEQLDEHGAGHAV